MRQTLAYVTFSTLKSCYDKKIVKFFLTISKKNKSPAFENIFQICFTQPKQMGFDEYVYQVSCQLNKNCCFERVFKSMAFLLL